MGEIEKRQLIQEMGFKENDKGQVGQVQWVLIEAKDNFCKYDLIESDLDDSIESSSSSEMIDDDASSPSCSPLFELSELMAQLPIKRGLSKFYQGKSESFGSLKSVENMEDLAKKGKYSCRSSRRSMKSQRLSPKATITKNKKGSIFPSLGKMSSLLAN